MPERFAAVFLLQAWLCTVAGAAGGGRLQVKGTRLTYGDSSEAVFLSGAQRACLHHLGLPGPVSPWDSSHPPWDSSHPAVSCCTGCRCQPAVAPLRRRLRRAPADRGGLLHAQERLPGAAAARWGAHAALLALRRRLGRHPAVGAGWAGQRHRRCWQPRGGHASVCSAGGIDGHRGCVVLVEWCCAAGQPYHLDDRRPVRRGSEELCRARVDAACDRTQVRARTI